MKREQRAFAALLAGGLLLAPSLSATDWPQLLGPHRDGTTDERVKLPQGEPPILWQRGVGSGYAGPAVRDGLLVLYHRRGDRALAEALDATTGERLWSFEHPTSYRDDFGFGNGPRATPTIDGGRVFLFGPQGRLHALRVADGELLWSVDTRRRFETAKGHFGVGSSPLVVDDRLIVHVGGRREAGIVAFDVASGEVLWQATSDEASYSSPIVARLGEETRALVWTRNDLVDLDPATGEVRATFRWRARSDASVNAATPLVVDGRVFLSAVYGVGAVLLEPSAGDFRPLWQERSVLSNHYATSVHRDGHLYGFHGAIHTGGASLRCIELATGELVWDRRDVRSGSLLLARDRLVVLTEEGELLIGAASPAGFEPEYRADLFDGEVRAAPALSGGLFFARDDSTLVVVDLRPPVLE